MLALELNGSVRLHSRRAARGAVHAMAALLAVGLGACATETVIHDIDEKESNEIVVLLAEHDIEATKLVKDTGRAILYSISVPGARKLDALKILTDHEYPRRAVDGYDKVYEAGGLIPTSAEEKAKKLRAIEGEIERQIMLLDGILDVQVNLVLPEENALRSDTEAPTPATASVAIKYLAGKGGAKPSDSNIRAVVAAGAEKVTTDHVVVVMSEARGAAAATAAGGGSAADCPESTNGHGKGIFGRLTEKTQKLMLAGIILLVLVLSLLLVFGQMRLRNVRGKLIRLQNEIAKARRKDAPAGAPAEA